MLDALWPDEPGGWLGSTGAWILTYLFHSTVLLAGVWLAASRRWIPSDVLQEALWKFAVLGGVFSASLQIGLGIQPFGGTVDIKGLPGMGKEIQRTDERGPEAPRTETSLDVRKESLPSVHKFPAHRLDPLDQGGSAKPEVNRITGRRMARESAPDQHADSGALLPAGKPSSKESLEASLPEWLSGCTAVASLFCLLLGSLGLGSLVLSWLKLTGRLAGRSPVREGPLPEMLRKLCRRAGLRKICRLTSSTRVPVPMAIGILRPEICLPVRAESDLGTAEKESMLAHELAHLARRDPAWLGLFSVLERVLFFQPLNRLARRRWQEVAEYRCDAWAVHLLGGSLPLARCLTEVADWIAGSRRWWRGAAVHGMAENRSILAGRITRLLEGSPGKTEDKFRPWIFPFLAGLLLLLTGAAPGITVDRREALRGDGTRKEESGPKAIGSEDPQPAWNLLLDEMAALDQELEALEEEVRALKGDLRHTELDEATRALIARMESHLEALRRKRARAVERFVHEAAGVQRQEIRRVPGEIRESGG